MLIDDDTAVNRSVEANPVASGSAVIFILAILFDYNVYVVLCLINIV